MWIYEKRLIYPVKIKRPNLRMAKLIAMLLGGPNGEMTAANTYLMQRYTMPLDSVKAILTDIGVYVTKWRLTSQLPTLLYIIAKALRSAFACTGPGKDYFAQSPV